MIDRYTPVQVTGLTGILAIAALAWHSVALKSDCTVRTWGFNFYGQLGDGTTATRLTSVSVPNLSNIIAITAGSANVWRRATALFGRGEAKLQGRGDRTTIDRYTDVQVLGAGGAGLLNLYRVALTVDKTGAGSGAIASSPGRDRLR
ncbi:MAG: hypothetical protein U5O69_10340 [Candidatus Competibacteraceae bacterium]|nr:hypothetical protein [Candidatus Competibacteraceae bacterium]